MHIQSDTKKAETIRDLYPNLTDEELAQAEDNLARYLELILRMYRRLQADPKSYQQFHTLTKK